MSILAPLSGHPLGCLLIGGIIGAFVFGLIQRYRHFHEMERMYQRLLEANENALGRERKRSLIKQMESFLAGRKAEAAEQAKYPSRRHLAVNLAANHATSDRRDK